MFTTTSHFVCSRGPSWSWRARRTREGTGRCPGSSTPLTRPRPAPSRATTATRARPAHRQATKAQLVRRESSPARNVAGQWSEISHRPLQLCWRRWHGSVYSCKQRQPLHKRPQAELAGDKTQNLCRKCCCCYCPFGISFSKQRQVSDSVWKNKTIPSCFG